MALADGPLDVHASLSGNFDVHCIEGSYTLCDEDHRTARTGVPMEAMLVSATATRPTNAPSAHFLRAPLSADDSDADSDAEDCFDRLLQHHHTSTPPPRLAPADSTQAG